MNEYIKCQILISFFSRNDNDINGKLYKISMKHSIRIKVIYVNMNRQYKMSNFYLLFTFLELKMISMGQGQEVHARRIMAQALTSGCWVLLQNCHLSLEYVAEIMDQFQDSSNIHSDFRLWVTTEIHPKFPITLLQVVYFIWVIYLL